MVCAILALIALILTPIMNIWMSRKYLAVIKEKGNADSSAYKEVFEEY
jgi:NADH:ubiquinone oxidoreductase subunit H